MRTHTHAHVCTCTCTSTRTHRQTHACTRTQAHTHKDTHTHTHMHTHSHMHALTHLPFKGLIEPQYYHCVAISFNLPQVIQSSHGAALPEMFRLRMTQHSRLKFRQGQRPRSRRLHYSHCLNYDWTKLDKTGRNEPLTSQATGHAQGTDEPSHKNLRESMGTVEPEPPRLRRTRTTCQPTRLFGGHALYEQRVCSYCVYEQCATETYNSQAYVGPRCVACLCTITIETQGF